MHLSRQLNFWWLRCSWSIACRRCSNYIFILQLTLGFKIFRKDNCKPSRETFEFCDLVRLILEILRYINLFPGSLQRLPWRPGGPVSSGCYDPWDQPVRLSVLQTQPVHAVTQSLTLPQLRQSYQLTQWSRELTAKQSFLVTYCSAEVKILIDREKLNNTIIFLSDTLKITRVRYGVYFVGSLFDDQTMNSQNTLHNLPSFF